MDLRVLDIHDDDLMRHVHRVVDRGEQHGRDGMPRWTLTEWVEATRAPDSGERATSTSFENTHKWPARRRASSPRLRYRAG